MPEPYLVITSCPDLDDARKQARSWIENKLAAIVNILPQMDSIYRWKRELRIGKKNKIFIKTSAHRPAALQHRIKSTQPFAVAEILEFKIESGEPDYLDWIITSTQ